MNFVCQRIYKTIFERKKILFNSLPNDKILAWPKLKGIADDKLDVVKMMNSIFDQLENTMGKGENAGYQHFLFFPQCFLLYPRQKTSFQATLNLSFENALNLVLAKNLRSGK